MRLAAVLPRPLGSVLAIFVSSVLLVTPTSAGASAPGSNDLAPGDRLWASRYNGPADGSDAAHALGVSPDGSVVFVTGQSKGEDSDDDYATVAYDAANGTRLWVARARGIAADYAYALAVSPTGAVIFVTGLSWARGSDYDYATVAYDAATGAQLWATRYDGPANRDDYASALGVSPDGSAVFVTGYSSGGVDFDYATVAYDAATGAQLWATRYDGPANDSDFAGSLGVSPDGSAVFVTGNSWGGASADDYATVAYDADTGAQLWATRYNGPPTNGYDAAYALEVSPDGSAVFVTGSSRGGASSDDYATVAYTADTGAQLWATRYNGPANGFDSAYALGVSPDGSRLFVTGDSPGEASGSDYATVAYAADTGAQLWATRYNGPANGSDSAYALGVSLDGSALFVTGITWGGAAENDYATVAYNAATGVQSWATRARAHGDEYAIDLGVSPTGTAVYVTGFSERDPSAPYDFGTVAYEA
jgi:hypothetical protein